MGINTLSAATKAARPEALKAGGQSIRQKSYRSRTCPRNSRIASGFPVPYFMAVTSSPISSSTAGMMSTPSMLLFWITKSGFAVFPHWITSTRDAAVFSGSTPQNSVRLHWLSASTSSTRLPEYFASTAARLMAVVVFATPPLRFKIAVVFMFVRSFLFSAVKRHRRVHGKLLVFLLPLLRCLKRAVIHAL